MNLTSLVIVLMMIRHIHCQEVTKTSITDIVAHRIAKDEPRLRIINGTLVDIGRHRFMVAIIVYGLHVCGGTIISRHWTLTAAHCCYTEDKKVIPADKFLLSAGNVYWRDGLKYHVQEVTIHENYNEERVLNDVAMFKIFGSFDFGDRIVPIKLNPNYIDDTENSTTAMVIGWGFTDVGEEVIEESTEELKQVNVMVVPWYECLNYYPYVYPSHICVFNAEKTDGSCDGDSGGPLVSLPPTSQIGIVAFGADDCRIKIPEVYSRVSEYYGWIMKQLNKNSKRFGKLSKG